MKSEKRLVTQSCSRESITVLEGEVPVIGPSFDSMEQAVAMAVNFLRSGCPEVQLIPQIDGDTQFHDDVVETLGILGNFEIEATTDYSLLTIRKDD